KQDYARGKPFARLCKKDQATVYIDLKKITKEDWNNYKEKLEKELKKLFRNKEKGREQQQLSSITNLQKNVDLDETWEKIQRAIQKDTTISYEEQVSKKAKEWLAVLKDKYIEDQSKASTQDCQEEINDRRELEI
ncbi:9928_t:CDS:2, partial [Dentiscutata heterogama]